ncbi:MAG: nucleotidyl transferase AbiEii/AbiGii toxin family protein, partial [Cloacibacillus sp.]
MVFQPKVEILPAAQRELWPLLSEVPQDFVLYGGTAVALWFGHRTSVDFDFFSTTKDLFVSKTTDKLSFVKKFKV